MRNKNIVILTVLILLISSISFFVVHIKNLSERRSLTAFQKDISCHRRLEIIGEQIDDYQRESDGSNPPTLDLLFPIKQADLITRTTIEGATNYQGGECSYIYRGSDLDLNAPKEMIIAYDKLRNHERIRWVLFGKPLERIFHIDSNEVSEEKYNEFCKRILSVYDPNIRITVTGYELFRVPELNSVILQPSMYPEEQYRIISKNLLNDYDSGDFLIKVSTKAHSFNGWEDKAWFEDIRVIGLPKQEFQKAILRDNELRQELALPQKPVLDQ